MALTMEQLKNLMKQEKLRFFLDPDNPRIMFGATGLNGSYQFVISLENNGDFLQFRTLRFLFCPKTAPKVVSAEKEEVKEAENMDDILKSVNELLDNERYALAMSERVLRQEHKSGLKKAGEGIPESEEIKNLCDKESDMLDKAWGLLIQSKKLNKRVLKFMIKEGARIYINDLVIGIRAFGMLPDDRTAFVQKIYGIIVSLHFTNYVRDIILNNVDAVMTIT